MPLDVSVNDVLESAKKYGDNNVLHWDANIFRDNKKNNPQGHDCTYLTIKFKCVNGTLALLHLNFSKVIIASGAKLPANNDGSGTSPKNMVIVFRQMTKEEIVTDEYVAKQMETTAEQIIEDKRIQKSIDEIYTATTDFNIAMEIIEKSYLKICEELKSTPNLEFTIRKDKKVKSVQDVNVYVLRQVTREDKDTPNGTDIKLEFPLVRIKLMLNENSLVGTDYNHITKKKGFTQMVYDCRKQKKANKFTPVLATVTVGTKICQLDSTNVGIFITYKSIVSGTIEFDQITISKFGFSLPNKFIKLSVKRNKTNVSTVVHNIPQEDLEFMCGGETDSDVEMPVTEVAEKLSNVKLSAVEAVSDLEDNISGSDLEDNCEESE